MTKKIGEKQEFQYLDNIITKMISFVTLTLLKAMSIALELNKYLKPALFFKVALPLYFEGKMKKVKKH